MTNYHKLQPKFKTADELKVASSASGMTTTNSLPFPVTFPILVPVPELHTYVPIRMGFPRKKRESSILIPDTDLWHVLKS